MAQEDLPSAEELRAAPLPYPIWGRENIDDSSLSQMDYAMRLPVSVAGALMPDAHVGYGLPIGGVLAAENAVIPYAVGVDIACRMRLSLYPVSPHLLGQKKGSFEEALREKRLSVQEVGRLMRRYEGALEGYTYLSDDE